MRKSLQDIAHMVKDVPYPKQLPDEISHLHCYISDSGHCILCIPKVFMPRISSGFSEYEVPLPVRYVLEKGWEPVEGTDAICVDVPYDNIFWSPRA